MAANKDMSEWIKFFTAAGIPPGPAAKYALVFLDNRIQRSMLMDLTKEYLKEMGITIMGDIISVLKFAKTAHVRYESEKPAITALAADPAAKVEVKRQTTPGNRMLEHYMRKEGIMESSGSKVTVSPSMAVRLGAVPVAGSKKGSGGLAETAEVVPVKRPRMVKPEEEGGYIISMPKGDTPKTQKILEQRQQLQQQHQQKTQELQTLKQQLLQTQKQQTPKGASDKKTSVFSRLGSGSSTPSTMTSPTKAATPSPQSTGGSSVFNRLGGVRKRVASDSSDSVVEYQGVLKSLTSPGTAEKPKAPVVKVAKPTTVNVTLGGAKRPSSSPGTSFNVMVGKPSSTTSSGTPVSRARSLQARLGAPIAKRAGVAPPASSINQKVTVTIGGAKRAAAGVPKQSMMDRLGVQRPEISTTTHTHMDTVGKTTKVRDRLGGLDAMPSATTVKETMRMRLSSGKTAVTVKKPMQARLGAQSKAMTLSAARKPAPVKQTVTVTIGGKSSAVQNRLGKATPGVSKVSPSSAASAKILKRLGAPVMSAVPKKKSTVQNRLGLMRAEVTSTTPSVTVTMDGGTMKNRLASSGVASKKTVFSRLGSSP